MRADELEHEELLELDPEGGVIRFAGQRALLLDAVAMGGVTLLASYEAEQHLLHFGRSDVPVCWTICGLTSGYVSRSSGKEIYVLEDRCLAKGDAACHLIGRTREDWGNERAEELRFFESKRLEACLDVSLHRVTE